jgi:hypothetical protein
MRTEGVAGSGGVQRRRSDGAEAGPTPIWHSRLYQKRRAQAAAYRLRRKRLQQFSDGSLLKEKRALADHLLRLCEKAERALRRRGGDIAGDLERIQDLEFTVGMLDSEAGPHVELDRFEELRSYLEAMVLAIEVARVAGALGTMETPSAPAP